MQVVKLYQEQIGAVGEVALVGDFDTSLAVKKLTAMTADWKAKVPYQRIHRPMVQKVAPSRDTIPTPDKANAVYASGFTLPLVDTAPEYPAMSMANYMLGASGFTSVLFDRLRQKEGLSYTAGSQLSVDSQDPYTQFFIFAFCNPENLNKADKVVDEVLTQVLKDGLTAKQLEDARKGYLQELQVERGKDSSLASELRSGLYLGRTFDYVADMEAKVSKLTLAEVNEAVRSLAQANRLVIVRAGDPAKMK